MLYSRLLFLLFLLSSCKTGPSIDFNNTKNKVNYLYQTSFIYDLECIPLEKLVIADTLWQIPIPSEYNGEPFLAYTVTGDCSYCIVAAIDFIHTYSSITGYNRKIKMILVKGDKNIFTYYLNKEDFNEKVIKTISEIPILSINTLSTADDGIYLIYNKRIINYATWKL